MCRRMLDSAVPRMHNQAMLNFLYNGGAPYTPEEAEADHHHTNVNFLEGTQKLHEARSQATNALKAPDQYFSVQLTTGDVHRRAEWSDVITSQIRRIMKRSQRYSDVVDAKIANMVLAGIGVASWADRDDWCATPRRFEDVMIPDETFTSLSNLTHFALRTRFTITDLCRVISGPNVDKGWNIPQVKLAIQNLKLRGPGSDQYNFYYDPEKLVEDWKQNTIYYNSDSVPVLHCFDFYYYDDNEKRWYRRIVVDTDANSFNQFNVNEFLYYNPDRYYGDEPTPCQIMHAQIADGAAVAPFRWHSVRSLGYLLYSLCQLQNRIRCRFMDATFESMNWYFRDVTDGDREVIQKVDIHHLGVIPNGLHFVPANERHNIDFDLVSGAMSMNRQLMSENSSSYNQDINDGTKKERTAYEVATLSNDANRLITAMLTRIYENQIPEYREICRRLCTTDHKDSIEFRTKCRSAGVPTECFDVNDWDVVPEKVLGGGNKMIQMAQAGQLMSVYDKLTPQGQQLVLHRFIETVTSDPDVANEIAPLESEVPTPSMEKASMAWATLIDGKPIVITGDLNRTDIVEEWLKLLAIEFTQIDQSGQPPAPRRLFGIANVIQTTGQIVQQLSMDPANGPRVKLYSEALANAQNKVKEYAKIIASQQPQGPQADPTILADMQAKQIQAESDAHINEAKAMQKLQHNQQKFEQTSQQNAAKTAAQIESEAARTKVQIAGEVARQRVQADSVQPE